MKRFSAAVGTLAFAGIALADPITTPNEFVAGQPALAEEINENFQVQTDAINLNDSRITENTGNITTLQGDVAALQGDGQLPTLILGPAGPGAFGENLPVWPAFEQVDSLDLPAGNWLVNFNIQLDIRDQPIGSPPITTSASARVFCRTNYQINDSVLETNLSGIAWSATGLNFNSNIRAGTLSTLVQSTSGAQIILQCTNFDDRGSFARVNRSHVTALQVGNVLRANTTDYGTREQPQ